MILKSKILKVEVTGYRLQVTSYRGQNPGTWNLKPAILIACCLLPVALLFAGCYTFKDIGSIPKEVKTFRVNYIENRARYINPQLSPQLTDKLRQKITGQTRLTGVQSDDAHYDISGQITGYNVTTSGISNQTAATQRLTVTVHINFRNNLDQSKNFEADVSRNFDYSASLTLTQAEAQLTETIVKQVVDEIFNRIFSNW
ncbi:LPS assembly lipoprotein LptE [Niastella vici]|uniref:LPS assembly lipoprotein LptE n=1 Tax=Niastella vici TaxID=1703345 RepID=UPI0009BCE6E2|nr:LptE family protein [Niastella vici]